jgi:hypothetical protein
MDYPRFGNLIDVHIIRPQAPMGNTFQTRKPFFRCCHGSLRVACKPNANSPVLSLHRFVTEVP